jgi:hypothetical protein
LEEAEQARLVKKKVFISETGNRCGESHPKATVSDEEVGWMRELHEVHDIGMREIARKFECPLRTVRDILAYRSRYATISKVVIRQASVRKEVAAACQKIKTGKQSSEKTSEPGMPGTESPALSGLSSGCDQIGLTKLNG